MKEYEHRRLVCEHECKVGEKYVLPQAQDFVLSWSIAKDSMADIHSYHWGRIEMQQQMHPELRHVGEPPPLSPRVQLLPPW